MLDLMKKMIGNKETDAEKQDGDKNIYLATCALLIELANVDGEFSKQEKDDIINVFMSRYGLPKEEIEKLIRLSQEKLEKSIDLWHFTNLINQNYNLEEKLQVIETVWEVAYADGRLDQHEDYLVHKIATLLRLSHKQLIDAKLKILHNSQ